MNTTHEIIGRLYQNHRINSIECDHMHEMVDNVETDEGKQEVQEMTEDLWNDLEGAA